VDGESDHFKQVTLACNDGVQLQLITGVAMETQTEAAFFAAQEGGWDPALGRELSSKGGGGEVGGASQPTYLDDAELGQVTRKQTTSAHTGSDPGGYELVATGAEDNPPPTYAAPPAPTQLRVVHPDVCAAAAVVGQYKTLAPRPPRRTSSYASLSVLDHAGKGLNRTAAQSEGDTAENPMWSEQQSQKGTRTPRTQQAVDAWVGFFKENL
jgi:hypothetical protein